MGQYNTQNAPATMSHPNQAGGPVDEEHYELPPFAETFEAVSKAIKRSNIQDALEALANQGYYVVRKRQT